jgi:hypothetical protein
MPSHVVLVVDCGLGGGRYGHGWISRWTFSPGVIGIDDTATT